MTLLGEQSSQTNIIELFLSSEYSLTNYSALQAMLNFMEDRYCPTQKSTGRIVTPNDLHGILLRAGLVYYLICRKSEFYKIALDTDKEEEIKAKIVNPIAGFLVETFSQVMQSTRAIGSMISAPDLATNILAAINTFDTDKDEEAAKIKEFVEAVSEAILTPTIKQVLAGREWLEHTDANTISKLIFKTCIFSYMSVSVNSLIKDTIQKHLPMGVFLNTLMVASHCISALSLEEKSTDKETSFAECGTNLTHAAAFALCMVFENKAKDEKEDPAYRFIPSAFKNIANTYNQMAEAVNKAMDENEIADKDGLEKLSTFSEEDIATALENINKMISEDIKARNQEQPLDKAE